MLLIRAQEAIVVRLTISVQLAETSGLWNLYRWTALRMHFDNEVHEGGSIEVVGSLDPEACDGLCLGVDLRDPVHILTR